jgi:protein tyrosine/serine phosphatase
VGFVLLLSAGLFPSAAQTPAKKQSLPSLHNFGQVTDTLFRGAQPSESGYVELKKQGVEIVVSFREDPAQIAAERRAVEALGMRFVSIPWPSFDSPRNSQVAEFLELLRANPGKNVFAHCRRGAERTGVMVAAFRIAAEKWTPQQALNEMETFGFRGFWFHHLKTYVRKFPGLLQSDPTLRPATAPAR